VSQSLVLAIEPDLRQAAIIKRIVREKAFADIAVVDSLDAAIEAMRTAMPDVLLLSALLSPRDEDHLIAHLKTLDGAGHLQTHTIPQLASALQPGEGRGSRGLLSAFRRKKEPASVASGCDPDLFADEIRVFLQRAADKKREMQHPNHAALDMRPSPANAPRSAAAQTEAPSTPSSSWSSPFEWKPSNASSPIVHHSSPIPEPASPIARHESTNAEPASEFSHHGAPAANYEPTANYEAPAADYEAPAANYDAQAASDETLASSPDTLAISESPVPELVVEPAVAPANLDLMAHLRPPAGIVTAEQLAAAAAEQPVPADVSMEAPPIEAPVPVPIAEPVQIPAPVPIAVSAEPARPKARNSGSAPKASRSGIKDSGLGIKDSGLAIRDQRSGIRDSRLGALASWARSENQTRDAGFGDDDLRGLLTGLAVPSAVVAVGYGRGCRIRRVRVPATREPKEAEAVGAVIISKRALAEQRASQG
jgi:hypothetical protein